MNIQPLCGRLGLAVCDYERRKRMWQMGLAQAMHQPPLTESIPEIIETKLLEPLSRELRRQTGRDIRYRRISLNAFQLLDGGKPFARLSLPNPGTGRVFIRYLDPCGRQCTPTKELRNTDEITGHLLSHP